MILTAKTAEQRRLEQEDMARAIRAYTGPVTKCPPGKAEAKRGWMPEARSLRQSRRHANRTLISLNDRQLACVMDAARCLDHEKRNTFLERVAGLLRLQAGRYGDDDVCRAVDQALRSLSAINTAA